MGNIDSVDNACNANSASSVGLTDTVNNTGVVDSAWIASNVGYTMDSIPQTRDRKFQYTYKSFSLIILTMDIITFKMCR